MKKNILTVAVLALCLVNLVMTALLIFTVLPATKKTDALITQVASVINLELTGYGENSYKATDVEEYKITEELVKNLKREANPDPSAQGSEKTQEHIAKMDYVSVFVNKNSEDYSKYNKDLTEGKFNSKIMDITGTTIMTFTYEDVTSNPQQVKSAVLSEIKKYFGSSDFIVDITFGNIVYT